MVYIQSAGIRHINCLLTSDQLCSIPQDGIWCHSTESEACCVKVDIQCRQGNNTHLGFQNLPLTQPPKPECPLLTLPTQCNKRRSQNRSCKWIGSFGKENPSSFNGMHGYVVEKHTQNGYHPEHQGHTWKVRAWGCSRFEVKGGCCYQIDWCTSYRRVQKKIYLASNESTWRLFHSNVGSAHRYGE